MTYMIYYVMLKKASVNTVHFISTMEQICLKKFALEIINVSKKDKKTNSCGEKQE